MIMQMLLGTDENFLYQFSQNNEALSTDIDKVVTW